MFKKYHIFMKMKLKALGRVLGKDEQKKIIGGVDEDFGCDCGCKKDSDCGTFVCSTTVSPCGPTNCNAKSCVPR
jgi:hypothetical protein